MAKHILSFVNEPFEVVEYDRAFLTEAELVAFINERHPKWVSYGTVVVREDAISDAA